MDLILSTLISTVLFVPSAYYVHKNVDIIPLKVFLTGGAAWSLTALVTLLPTYLLLFKTNSMASYQDVMENIHYAVFGLILLFAAFSELFRFKAVVLRNYFDNKIKCGIMFGLGWSISEYITRYMVFFKDTDGYFLNSLILFLLLFAINASFAVMLIRTSENGKYYIFAVFMKVIVDIALFGSFGFNPDIMAAFGDILGVVIFLIVMVAFSLFVRKYPMED